MKTAMKTIRCILPYALCLAFLLTLLSPAARAIGDDETAGESTDAFLGTEDIRSLSDETDIGDLAADAVRHASGADIAVLNSGDLGRNLIGGTITYADCRAVFTEDRELAVVTVTPAQLKDILECGVSHIVMNSDEETDRETSAWGGFPQISGFVFQYDVSALVGSRIRWIEIDGDALDLADNTTTLTLCATAYMLSGGWDCFDLGGGEPVGMTLSEALFTYICEQGTISLPVAYTGRIQTAGSKDNGLFELLGVSPLILFISVLIFGSVRSWRFKKYYDFRR